MAKAERIRIATDGSIKLPGPLREKLGWVTGSYLEFDVVDGELVLRRVEVDPFQEAAKGPDEDTFQKAMRKQKESSSKASDEFDRKIKEPIGELRPEERPQFWD